MYSFGATAFEIVFEERMWDVDDCADKTVDERTLLKMKIETERIPKKLLEKEGHLCYKLILNCVQFDYNQRPQAISVVGDLEALREQVKELAQQ